MESNPDVYMITPCYMKAEPTLPSVCMFAANLSLWNAVFEIAIQWDSLQHGLQNVLNKL